MGVTVLKNKVVGNTVLKQNRGQWIDCVETQGVEDFEIKLSESVARLC